VARPQGQLRRLFTRRFKPSAAFGTFRDRGIAFGIVRDSDTIEAFGNPPLPSIWLFKGGAKVMYKGKQDFAALGGKIQEHYGVHVDDEETL
jgi:hypothetical protein